MWDPVQRLEHVARGTTTRRAAAPRRPTQQFGEFDARARRLDARRRAVHERRRAARSTGSARACSAAAPTTGAASRCASVPTTSGARASTASATTGRSPTTTSSRIYDEVDKLIGIFGTNLDRLAQRAGRHLPAAAAAALLRAADQAGVREAEHPCRPVAPVDPHASRSTAGRRATTAASAAAAARRTRTSRRRRC